MTAGPREEVEEYTRWMKANLPADPVEREKVLADPARLLALIKQNPQAFPEISGASYRHQGEQAGDVLRLAEKVASSPTELEAARLLGRLEAEPEAFAGRIARQAKGDPAEDQGRLQGLIDRLHAEHPAWTRERLLDEVSRLGGLSINRLADRLRSRDPRTKLVCLIPAKKPGRPRK